MKSKIELDCGMVLMADAKGVEITRGKETFLISQEEMENFNQAYHQAIQTARWAKVEEDRKA